ncbi:MAG TPA: tetratricopeptide repeat protein [Gemmatimonadales bacterium]|jgi:tetratricopeptide (TPR) repeat protein|nr:tetratricopeptide repeat protein [Gemmatimonadales bacterium]
MSKLEQRKEKARSLEARDPRGAIEQWLGVLKGQEEEEQPNPDLSIFNRIGDLYLKIKDPGLAADYYDQAVDKYAELGFHNNAIAMCNKVLRNAPGRQTTYLKLAKLYAAKGFMAEAKQHFVEYAERMQKVGKIQQAFAALKEFADISPESADLRRILEEHLRMYGGEEEHRASGTSAPAKAEPEADVTKSGRHKTSSLVFLDVDMPSRPKGATPVARPSPAPPPVARPPVPAPRPEPVVEGLIEPPTADPDTSLEIESTSLVENLEAPGSAGLLDGFETTTQFGDVRLDPGEVQSLREEVTAEEIPPLAEFEPTVPTDAAAAAPESELKPLRDSEIEIEPPGRRGASEPAPPRGSAPPGAFPKTSAPPRGAPFAAKRPGAAAPAGPAEPRATGPRMPKLTPPSATPPPVKPVVPRKPEPPKRKTVVEVPPLELEPDFETGEADAGLEPDAEPLASDALETTQPPKGRRSGGFIDLGLDDAGHRGGDQRGSLVFANLEATPVKPSIEQLEALVADDPDDPEAHQALGEALIEEGDRERGLEELDHATTGFENRGNLQHARDLVDEILRVDPNSVRHRQKQVEFAFKAGDKERLIDAYVELADALLRSDLPEKARAVYQRVAEHDPGNARAKAALGMLAPVGSGSPPPDAKPKPKHKGEAEGKTKAKDAKLTVRDHAADVDGDFVDLGAMMLEEAPAERDTRMKVADEEPTGDEERDFQDMLTRFKQGIDENIDEGDFQSHYDLGIAFKEMGLLDEAISELQKALRAPDGKLRSSEALGLCFIEKEAFVVAESILRRALDLPASGDQERLGLLYWLGRALEAQGKKPEARELYGRVFAVDIRFLDVGERAKALARAK